MRHSFLLLTLILASCGKDKSDGNNQPLLVGPLDIPSEWEARESAVVLRLTNASTTSTEVRRALNEMFNDPLDPVDAMDFVMRNPERDPATGALVPVDAGASPTELLGGSSLEQLTAYKAQVVDGGGQPFDRAQAVDACGNEMIAALLPPGALAEVFGGASSLPIWPSSCPDDACETASFGIWDVALGEMRFDGMIDMVINVMPNVQTDPLTPGAWGHLSAFFLSNNNPGFLAAPLFANVRRAQVNLTGVWQLDRAYADPMGLREVYRFPHRTRTLDTADIFVYLEGYAKGDEYWRASGGPAVSALPFGFEQSAVAALDVTAPAGNEIASLTRYDEMVLQIFSDLVTYQLGAALACPNVSESAYFRQGPVEFFLCPDIDVPTCMAREDMEEAACTLQAETPFDPFNPFVPPIVFPRVEIVAPTTAVPLPADRLPHYLAYTAPTAQVEVELAVTPDSVLYLLSEQRALGAIGPNGQPIALPAPIVDTHCADDGVRRFNVGETWPAGTYRVQLDFTEGLPGAPDALVFDALGLEGPRYLLWAYHTSVPAWSAP